MTSLSACAYAGGKFRISGGVMATITWTGSSGKKYEFTVHSKDTEFEEVGGVYVITRELNDVLSMPIYIGQTDNLSMRFDNHHKLDCFNRHDWNTVCIHKDDNEDSRFKKELDLIQTYDPICNEIGKPQ